MLSPGFGKRLQEARRAANLTQADVGAFFDLQKQAISAWEQETNLPSAQQLATLCKELDVSSEWLLFGVTPPPISAEVLRRLALLSPDEARRVENTVRGYLEMSPLPVAASGKHRNAA